MREKLPHRRSAVTESVLHVLPDGDSQEILVTVGRYIDGRVAEVFVDMPWDRAKHMTSLLGKDVSTLISIALQNGATVEEMSAAMGRSEVNHMGKMVERPHTIIGTVLDYLARQ